MDLLLFTHLLILLSAVLKIIINRQDVPFMYYAPFTDERLYTERFNRACCVFVRSTCLNNYLSAFMHMKVL